MRFAFVRVRVRARVRVRVEGLGPLEWELDYAGQG